MKVLSKEVVVCHEKTRAPFPGLVGYISTDRSRLIHRYGWEYESDNRDDWVDMFSEDNGRTWSQPVLAQKSRAVPGGRIKHTENAGFFDVDTNRLIVMASKLFYPENKLDVDQKFFLEMTTFDSATGRWSEGVETDLGIKEGVAVSFTFPIKTSSKKLLFPACKMVTGEDGKPLHYPGCWSPAYQALVVIGEYQTDGSISWRASRPVALDLERSTRGFDENTIFELKDGRIAMIIRGSNETKFDQPGYKWVAYSEDDGSSWSKPVPMVYTEGRPVESSATGSAIFRSVKSGNIYWMGNLCLDGRKAQGNWPRSPLYIVEVQEEPFAFKRETVEIIDQRGPEESPGCQLSNFRYYQDRETGDIVLYLTRFGERSEKDWILADYYKYRIEL
jgi:hypothetical protein